jgi:hypothetical protein
VAILSARCKEGIISHNPAESARREDVGVVIEDLGTGSKG